MKQTAVARKRQSSTPHDLSTQAHEQIMAYLRLADKSTNPAIIDAAVNLANQRQEQQRKAEAKISPGVATVLATLIVVSAGAACWYALVHHPGGLGYSLVVVISTLAILLVCLYALFSGHLSQVNFMSVLRWAGERLNRLNPFDRHKD